MATSLLVLSWMAAMLGMLASNIDHYRGKLWKPLSSIRKSQVITASIAVVTLTLGLNVVKEYSVRDFLGYIQLEKILNAQRELQAGRIEERIRKGISDNRDALLNLDPDTATSEILKRMDQIVSQSKTAVKDAQYVDILSEFPAPAPGKIMGFIPTRNKQSNLLAWLEDVEGKRVWDAYRASLQKYLPGALARIFKDKDPSKFDTVLQQALAQMVQDVTAALKDNFDRPIVDYYKCLASFGSGCIRPS